MANAIEKELNIKEFTYQIENKSLDARKKKDIHFFRCPSPGSIALHAIYTIHDIKPWADKLI